jgi:hypothetical protein
MPGILSPPGGFSILTGCVLDACAVLDTDRLPEEEGDDVEKVVSETLDVDSVAWEPRDLPFFFFGIEFLQSWTSKVFACSFNG